MEETEFASEQWTGSWKILINVVGFLLLEENDIILRIMFPLKSSIAGKLVKFKGTILFFKNWNIMAKIVFIMTKMPGSSEHYVGF